MDRIDGGPRGPDMRGAFRPGQRAALLAELARLEAAGVADPVAVLVARWRPVVRAAALAATPGGALSAWLNRCRASRAALLEPAAPVSSAALALLGGKGRRGGAL